MDMVSAFRIALGRAIVPPEWLELVSDTPEESALWKTREFLAEP